jgi:hypothetical protein
MNRPSLLGKVRKLNSNSGPVDGYNSAWIRKERFFPRLVLEGAPVMSGDQTVQNTQLLAFGFINRICKYE